MANRCMEILLERVRHANGRALPAEQIVLEPALLVRDSTARPISL
jgi:DNA-binding LacI/PurR family transcriptional regulator